MDGGDAASPGYSVGRWRFRPSVWRAGIFSRWGRNKHQERQANSSLRGDMRPEDSRTKRGRRRDKSESMAATQQFIMLMVIGPALFIQLAAAATTPLVKNPPSISSSFSKISSISSRNSADPRRDGSNVGQRSSVLAALMESPYTELMELMERAGMLEPLEKVIGSSRITILAPRNAYMESAVDAEFRSWLIAPGNARMLRQTLKHHILPHRFGSSDWKNMTLRALSTDPVRLNTKSDGVRRVDLYDVVAPDSIVRDDGIVHGINGFLVPRSVQAVFAARTQDRRSLVAVLPEAAPVFDPSAASLSSMNKALLEFLEAEAPLPLDLAMAPEIAPAPAPGPSSGKHKIYSWEDVDDFVSTLANFGGYSEMAELLVNLTSFAWDMAKLVNEGHRLTLLAPNDKAIDHLTTEQLNAPGGIEAMLMYHVLTEYQTEESLYNAVRHFEKVSFPSLRTPHTVKAKEADGTVQFGDGETLALLYDHDIFTDGHLSVQGINKVLLPPSPAPVDPEKSTKSTKSSKRRGLSESASSQQQGLSIQTIREFLHI